MTTSKTTRKPRIINQHEYISVDLGNGRRLTASFRGEKATGSVPKHVFDAWCRAVSTQEGTVGERITAFVDRIDTVWPEWHVGPPARVVGDVVELDFGKGHGVDSGPIVSKRGARYTVRFARRGLVSVPADLLR
jgi:hypothetical protein